jgi:hypothetical protein
MITVASSTSGISSPQSPSEPRSDIDILLDWSLSFSRLGIDEAGEDRRERDGEGEGIAMRKVISTCSGRVVVPALEAVWLMLEMQEACATFSMLELAVRSRGAFGSLTL